MLRRMKTRDEIAAAFLETLPFDPYPFQEEALLTWFDCEGGMMVCAPTGMGKTLLAEAAVFEALHTNQRLYYTTPLIALTDQKYRDLQELVQRWGFPPEKVGLITGNRRENADAPIRVVVAEILLNHLIAQEDDVADAAHLGAVVMDEFHSFNLPDRGIVWELSLVLLPQSVRVMLLSATVGNPYEFADWLKDEHKRKVDTVITAERRVPLEFVWVEDKLLTEQLVEMVSTDDETNRTPALVFAFNRDECWDLAEKLKGLPLVGKQQKQELEAGLDEFKEDLADGVGPKLRQMLLRGVGVHHAGVLPKHKEVVEVLFERKLVPFVCCTETLAAGINLPARSVVLSTLIKGKPGEKKLIPASSAHQMFGRAGRPQYDTQGYVFAVAHDDDVKINKWKKKYDQIDPNSKDPGIMRARKDLERKKPSRRKTEQYWAEGQLKTLIEAGPAKLASRAMIPYPVLIYLLTRTGTLADVRAFLEKRFAPEKRIDSFKEQLDHMLANLAALDYLTLAQDGAHVTLHASIEKLLKFRSIDPLFGVFLAEKLNYADDGEKLRALEASLELPWNIAKKTRTPDAITPGPLQRDYLEPLMTQMGVRLEAPEPEEDDRRDWWMLAEDDEDRPPDFPEMLKLAFEHTLAAPEPVWVQDKWVAAGIFDAGGEFFKFVGNRRLVKQEGLVLRHLLRLVVLGSEFYVLTEDPVYQDICDRTTEACQKVDRRYTERFLAEAENMRKTL